MQNTNWSVLHDLHLTPGDQVFYVRLSQWPFKPDQSLGHTNTHKQDSVSERECVHTIYCLIPYKGVQQRPKLRVCAPRQLARDVSDVGSFERVSTLLPTVVGSTLSPLPKIPAKITTAKKCCVQTRLHLTQHLLPVLLESQGTQFCGYDDPPPPHHHHYDNHDNDDDDDDTRLVLLVIMIIIVEVLITDIYT